MITINLDQSSPKSLYIQLYESIKKDITDKKLAPDTLLPSKRALSAHLGISVKTIENAYSQLLLEGYIYSVGWMYHPTRLSLVPEPNTFITA